MLKSQWLKTFVSQGNRHAHVEGNDDIVIVANLPP